MMGEVLRPYDPPRGEGVAARVQMARTAAAWREDIQAVLAESELPVDLAGTVERLVDVHGISIRHAVDILRRMIDDHR